MLACIISVYFPQFMRNSISIYAMEKMINLEAVAFDLHSFQTHIHSHTHTHEHTQKCGF